MPIFGTPDALGFNAVTPFPQDLGPKSRPSGDDVVRAAWENNNIIGSSINALRNFQMPGEMEEGFDIREHITGFENQAEAFIGVRNVDDVNQVKARLAREAENREILQSTDFSGMLTATIVGALDPTWLIPGTFASTQALKAIESTALRAAYGAAGGAAALGATVALQEGILYSTQLSKPSQEVIHNSLYAAAGGAILGGLAGALTRAQRQAFDQVVMDAGTGDFTSVIQDPAFIGPTRPMAGPPRPAMGNSAGAMAAAGLDPYAHVAQPNAADVAPANVGSLKRQPGVLGAIKEYLFNTLFDWTPQGQAARSNFETIQKLGPQIFHTDFLSHMNKAGHSIDAALETLIEVKNAPLKVSLRNALESYTEYAKRLTEAGQTPLKREEFGRLVMDSLRRSDQHVIKEVADAAGHLRKNFDSILQRGIDVDFISRKPKVRTSETWAPRIINRLKVQAERYLTMAKDGVRGPLERVITYLEDVNTRIARGEKVYTNEGLELLDQASLTHEAITQKIAQWQKTQGPGKLKLTKIQQETLSQLQKEAKHFEQEALNHVFSKTEPSQLTRKANEILDNYLSIDLHEKTNQKFQAKFGSDSLRPGTFKSRKFMIEDELFKDYWIDDAFEAAYRHHMSTNPYLTTAEFLKNSKLGSVDNILKELGAEYDKMRPHVSGRAAVVLDKEYAAAQKYVTDSFDLMTGHFDRAIDHPGWRRLADAMNQYTSGRLLGGTPIAALDDVGRVILSRGMETFFADGWEPIMKALSDAKLDVRHWQDMNIAIDSILGFTRHFGDDLHQLYGERTKLERFLRYAGTEVHKLSGMQLQTRLLEEVYGRISMSANMRNIIGLVQTDLAHNAKALTAEAQAFLQKANAQDRLFKKGAWTIDKHGREMLAKLGFDKRDFVEYINNYVAAGGDIYEGAYLPAKNSWGNARLENNFRAAIQKDMTQTIIRPTKGDIPFWGHRKLGQTILKIRTFQFAALNKTTIPFLQRRDGQVLGDLVGRMFFGLTSYAVASKVRDPNAPLHSNWRDLSYEAIDRAALTGVVMELYNMGAKLGLVELGTGGLLGKDVGSRYQSRGPISAQVGPNIGVFEDLYHTIRAATRAMNDPDKPYSTNDAARAFHMLPLVRVWYLRYILEQAARSLSEKAGATPSPEKSTARK